MGKKKLSACSLLTSRPKQLILFKYGVDLLFPIKIGKKGFYRAPHKHILVKVEGQRIMIKDLFQKRFKIRWGSTALQNKLTN